MCGKPPSETLLQFWKHSDEMRIKLVIHETFIDFINTERILIGLQFSLTVLLSFLDVGVMSVYFKGVGKTGLDKELLKAWSMY